MNKKKDLSSAKSACYRLLKVRARSEKELRDRLKLKGFDNKVIDESILDLTEVGLVDDLSFARAWVDSRIKKPLGIHRLFFELKAKGISKEIIDQVLEEFNNSEKEEAAIRSLLESKLEKIKKPDKKKQREKLWGYFLRKGFSKEIVFEVLSEL